MVATELILVRHGESEGNLAREAAEAERAEVILIDERDPDVALTERGRSQAVALGRWLASLPDEHRPDAVWASPYTRAVQTAATALDAAGLEVEIATDERLRDRELGVLDRLTGRGVNERFPHEAERRRHLGKFYYRPPGGESWTDVALRLRSALADLDAPAAGGTILVVTHDAVILLIRYILERLTEQDVLDIAARQSVANAAVTRLVRLPDAPAWQITEFNRTEHLEQFGSEKTTHEAERDVHPR